MASIGTLNGTAAVFNSDSEDLGGFVESISPGAFSRCLSRNPDVRCLFNHQSSSLLGRTSSGTLKLSVNSKGLQYRCSLPDTPTGNEVRELVGRGDIDGSSFGFVCGEDSYDVGADGKLHRTILSIDELLDVSPVTFPAYPASDAGLA